MRIGQPREWVALYQKELGLSRADALAMFDHAANTGVLVRHPCGSHGIKWRINPLSDVALRGSKPAGLRWTLDDEERLLTKRGASDGDEL